MNTFLCNDPEAIGTLSALSQWGVRGARSPKSQRVGLASIIQMRGPISKYPGNGIINTTVDLIAAIEEAVDDPTVTLIVLWTDSPGGTIAGTEELARAVADAAKSKAVIGLVDGVAASAAYWVLSQSKKIYATNRTDLVGSIGAFTVIPDLSQQAAMIGIKIHVISSGGVKGAGVPGSVITDEQLANWSKWIHAVTDEFIRDVARGRKLPPDQVREMATGRSWMSAEAKRLGLIDGISSLDKILFNAHADVRRLADASNQFDLLLQEQVTRGMGDCQAREFVGSTQSQITADAAKFRALPEGIKSQFVG